MLNIWGKEIRGLYEFKMYNKLNNPIKESFMIFEGSNFHRTCFNNITILQLHYL